MPSPAPKAETPKAEPAFREPKVGDTVVYVDWGYGDALLHAKVASVRGRVVTLSYLTPYGNWCSAVAVNHSDPPSAGSWSWPKA